MMDSPVTLAIEAVRWWCGERDEQRGRELFAVEMVHDSGNLMEDRESFLKSVQRRLPWPSYEILHTSVDNLTVVIAFEGVDPMKDNMKSRFMWLVSVKDGAITKVSSTLTYLWRTRT
ncbi:hypothetical protein [Chondromyces crocatus]|uniref:SnoaL-like domain-containing protein n=1 Tax=Chondromyces crocatus TaxID=52 RepID=A0A0K1ERV8_CHOCO|nr:hypothetical protein [Chondromyces crocatus]AKT43581.1 uncharacterized protein CMC5_078140 [Chondromyces crocatus]